MWFVQGDKDGSLNNYTNMNLSVIKERGIWTPETCHNTGKISFPLPYSRSLYQTGHPSVRTRRYSPFRDLASLIRRLHSPYFQVFSSILLSPAIVMHPSGPHPPICFLVFPLVLWFRSFRSKPFLESFILPFLLGDHQTGNHSANVTVGLMHGDWLIATVVFLKVITLYAPSATPGNVDESHSKVCS